MNKKVNQCVGFPGYLLAALFLGLFSCTDSKTNKVKFTISNQSSSFIDSVRIHIPSAQTVVKSLPPQASTTTVLQYNPGAVPKVDGSFLYSLYYKDGSAKKGSFGYYTNGWVDYFDKYEVIINKDSTIGGRGIK